MKLGLVIEQFDPAGGGAERSTAQMATELASRGHQVTVLAGVSPRDVQPETFTLETCELGNFRTAARLSRFAKWATHRVLSSDFDLTLSVTTTVPANIVQPRSGTALETLRRNIALRPTAWQRASKRLLASLSPKQHKLLRLERITIRHSNVRCFAAHSGYVARQLREQYNVSPDRIVVIPNASRMPEMSELERTQARERVRKAFNIQPDALVYLFAALNPRLKGVTPLLQAMAQLRQQGTEPVLLLAGGAGYYEQRLALKLGVRDLVRFIPASNHMADLFSAADVTVHPTFYDPSSKVVIESLMLGTPAISTRFDGSSDFIEPPGELRRGRVVADPANVNDLAQAMRELADADERARCRAATVGLRDELTMQRHIDQLEELLEQVWKTDTHRD